MYMKGIETHYYSSMIKLSRDGTTGGELIAAATFDLQQAGCQSRRQFVSNHQSGLFPGLFNASTSKLAMVNCKVWSSNSKSVQPNECNLLFTSHRFIWGATKMILARFLINPGIALCSTPFFSKRCIKISVSRFNLCPLYALRYVESKPSFPQTQPLAPCHGTIRFRRIGFHCFGGQRSCNSMPWQPIPPPQHLGFWNQVR